MDKEKSVFKCGAENGLAFGAYLSAIFFAFVYGDSSLWLSTLSVVLFLAIPVVLFVYIRRYYVAHPDTAGFGALWTIGSVTILCGALICGVVSYTWLEYVTPGFIAEQAGNALALYEQVPELKEHTFTKTLRYAIENDMLPSSIEFVLQMIWTTFSLGVVLSLIIVPFAKLKKPESKQN